jgi:DNA-(apurinic or apyrimidinic site) lyase
MEKCKIDYENANLISYFLKSLGPDYYYELELNDPQLEALKKIRLKCDEKCFYKFIIAASVVAYRLKTSGEIYWKALSEFEIKRSDPYRSIEEFILKNRELARNAKLKRLYLLKDREEVLSLNLENYKKDLGKLYEDLLKIYGTPYQKTISFACKMFHYGLITEGIHAMVPDQIPIPLDNRVLKVTKSLKLIKGQMKVNCALKAWRDISKKSGIDQLHIDVFIWRKLYFALY